MATISNDMLINGQLRSKASRGSLELIEPATEQVWNEVPAAGKKEINEALEAAAKAFRTSSWSSTNPGRRIDALYRIAALIREHADFIGVLCQLDLTEDAAVGLIVDRQIAAGPEDAGVFM